MAKNTPIVVTIKDDTGIESMNAGSSGATGKGEGVQNQQTKSNQKNSQLSAAGTYIAMQTFNYITSNIGKYTGNASYQTQVNNAKRLVGYSMALASNWALGLAVIAMDGATSIANYMYDRKFDQIRSEQAKRRNGDLGGYRR